MSKPRLPRTEDGWTLVHQVNWFGRVAQSLFTVIVGGCMALVFLAAALYNLGAIMVSLLHPLPNRTIKDLTDLPVYQSALVVLFGGVVGYFGLREVVGNFIDLVLPARTYEGLLDEVEEKTVQEVKGTYYQWTLVSAGKRWDLPPYFHAGGVHLASGPQKGARVRLKYLRGTRTVAEAWVKHEVD